MLSPLLKQKPFFEAKMNDAGQPLSAFSFINIFAWGDFFEFEWEVIDDCLCLFATNESGCFQYLPPLGKNIKRSTVDACFQRMNQKNQGKGISRIENVHESLLPLFPSGEFTRFKKSYEYCYFKNDLIALKGNRYKSKRSAYNQFKNRYRAEFQSYSEDMFAECLRLYEEWRKDRQESRPDPVYQQMLEENRLVHQRLLRYYRPLGLIGRVVLVNGEIKGYTFGYPLNRDVFCDLLEICDLKTTGLPVYIFRELCADPELEKFSFINVMDDFGMENLQRAKMSFHPRILFASYVVQKR